MEEVRDVVRHVTALLRVVDAHALCTSMRYTNDADNHQSELFTLCIVRVQQLSDFAALDAYKQEERSVRALIDLMTQTKELMCLWQIVLEQDMHSVIAQLRDEDRTTLLHSDFGDLVRQPEAIGVELIGALIAYYRNDHASTAALNERLGKDCSVLFTNDDANVQKVVRKLSAN